MTNPVGNFVGLDPDYDRGPIAVQWSDLGNGTAGKVHIVWENRNYVWDGVSTWLRMTQPGGGGGGGGTSSFFGAAFPTAGTAAGFKDTLGNMAAGLLDGSGNLLVNVAAGGAGGGVVQQGARDATAAPWYVTFNGTTQPVSIASAVDISDRAARLLGHVTVDNASLAVTGTFWQATQPVSGTFWQATQPVSLAAAVDISDRAARLLGVVYGSQAQQLKQTATNFNLQVENFVGATAIDPRDISDRAARLLGHVTVDNASIAVTGTFWQATQPVSGTVTANQGGAPWSENITQVGGTAIVAKAVPTGADGQVAFPVYVNAQQYLTYDVAMRNIATGALTTNTAKAVMSFEHGATSTKTVRIRRISIHAFQTTALAGAFDLQITKGTAASSAGTALTPNPRKGGDAAAEMVVKSLPTIVAATLGDIIPAGGFSATTVLYSAPVLCYDWQEAGEMKPLILRAGVLESIVFNIISVQLLNLTLTISVDFTEE